MCLNLSVSILVVLVAGLAVLVVLRRLGILPGSEFAKALPKSVCASNKTSRSAEALILLCAATAIIVFTATNTSTGGRLLNLGQLRPGFAATNIAVAVAAAAGVILGVLVAFLWRTSLGVLIVTIVACCYGLALNGPEQILESLAPEGSTVPGSSLTFRLSSPDVDGAELWVNGIHLGSLPYETTFEDFYQKVPHWAEEPNEFKNRSAMLFVPNRWNPYSSRASGSYYRPWVRITIPKEPVHWRVRNSRRIEDLKERRKIKDADKKSRTYYVRVKLGDEWGYASGGSNSSSGGGGRYNTRRARVGFNFVFPQRTARIEKLLDKARLSDYHPDAEWFETMQTYKADGWLAVRKAMDEETDMQKLLDKWATWQYGLNEVSDSESAWRAFEGICKIADERQYYLTTDIAGRAVELLVPRLDADRLVRRALSAIRSTQSFGWYVWRMNDRTQFGYSYRPEGLYCGANKVSGAWIGGRGGRLSPSDYAVAHAAWILDEMLDHQDDTQPNVIERKIVPAFMCWNFRNSSLLRIGAQIGGPEIERYLLRQRWRTKPKELPYYEQIRIRGEELNGWLYLLANLKSPLGRKFRQENSDRLMRMADVATQVSGWDLNEGLDFLFIDRELGEKSLASRYWPRFKRLTNQKKLHDALRLQFEYLSMMEPYSTVEQYVEAWKDFPGDHEAVHEGVDQFDKLSIMDDKRDRLLAALTEQVHAEMSDVTLSADEKRLRERLLRELKAELTHRDGKRQPHAERIFGGLKTGSSDYKPNNIAAWLAHTEPTHPLVKMLADSDEPGLRLLVMGALREHPIPANRAILQKLLQDSDEEVRKAAKEAATALKTLKEAPVEQLAAKLDEIVKISVEEPASQPSGR